MKFNRVAVLAILMVGMIGLLSVPAFADSIPLGQGSSVTLNYVGANPGYSGTLTLTLTGNSLTISLTNTGSAGSFIGAIGLSTTPTMTLTGTPVYSGGVSAYSICGTGGCGLGNNIQVGFGGNGTPEGLQAGQSGTITFNFTSTPSNPDPLMIDLDLIHFQGLGVSEKLSHTTEAPEPASMFLMGTGLVGISTMLRKRFIK